MRRSDSETSRIDSSTAPAPQRLEHAPSLLERVRRRLESMHEFSESVGAEVPGAGFVLVWWRRIGLGGVLTLVAALLFAGGGYSWLAFSASRVIPDWVGDFGVRFDARETEIHLLDLQVIARDVTLRADERSEPVFRASEVTFDGSLRTLFRGLFGPGAFYNEITIRKGELHVERSLGGDWNLRDFLAAVPADRQADALAGLYKIRGIHLEDFRVTYVEHVPGNSGSGVIQTAQATIHIDDLNGSILDLVPPASPGDRPTRFQLKARSADGIVQIKGAAGLFRGKSQPDDSGPSRVSQTTATPPAGRRIVQSGPYFQMNIYLENIGLGAVSRMVTTTALLATKGSVRGTLDVERNPTGVVCRGALQTEDVEFVPNPRLVLAKAQRDQLDKELRSFRASESFTPCAADDANSEWRATSGTATALVASLNVQATRSAPPIVRASAARDEQRLAGVVADAAVNDLLDSLADKAGDSVTGVVGAKSGQLVQDSLKAAGTTSNPSEKDANAVTRGVKSIGGGVKRLFGGDKKKDD